jgi:hypothetical protein
LARIYGCAPAGSNGDIASSWASSINQRAVLNNCAVLVDELYAAPLSSRVISAGA